MIKKSSIRKGSVRNFRQGISQLNNALPINGRNSDLAATWVLAATFAFSLAGASVLTTPLNNKILALLMPVPGTDTAPITLQLVAALLTIGLIVAGAVPLIRGILAILTRIGQRRAGRERGNK